jgi:hypothetical protein
MMPTALSRMMFAVLIAVLVLVTLPTQARADSNDEIIAQGGGTTIIEGGTGGSAPVPVLTTVAFHVRRSGKMATGAFECLARAPESSTGSHSAQFTVNVMYVTGVVTDVTMSGDEAVLQGVATITGLGAGSNVPFTFSVRNGGPGTPAVLTTGGLTFKETLVEGAFRVSHRP